MLHTELIIKYRDNSIEIVANVTVEKAQELVNKKHKEKKIKFAIHMQGGYTLLVTPK